MKILKNDRFAVFCPGLALLATWSVPILIGCSPAQAPQAMKPKSAGVRSASAIDTQAVTRALGGRPPWLALTFEEKLSAEERAYLERLEHGARIQLTVIVMRYIAQAEGAWNEGTESEGTSAWYDEVKLRVTDPSEHQGASLTLSHEGTLPASSPWRNVRARYRITVPSAALERRESLGWLGTGIVESIELLEGPRPSRVCETPTHGVRQPASQESLLRELGAVLAWISQLCAKEGSISMESWCQWQDEVELGIRLALPSEGPPPVRDLPDVRLIVGMSRSQVRVALGDPVWGCELLSARTQDRKGYSEVKRLQYPFYKLDGVAGGGLELWLDFDASDMCTQASWVHTQ
ncbi:MAG: hypothetical protein JXA30_14155 [Deltaproteobacteria bacterium]|nr:hypothetical protein [Deltaproteobacteria bacterium]